MLFNVMRGGRIELSLELRVPLALVLLGRDSDDILGPLLLGPFLLFGGACWASLLPGTRHQLVCSLTLLLLVSPVSLNLSCDILDALLKPVNLTCLVSLASRPLLNRILQLLLIPAQNPLMLLHLLVVVH